MLHSSLLRRLSYLGAFAGMFVDVFALLPSTTGDTASSTLAYGDSTGFVADSAIPGIVVGN